MNPFHVLRLGIGRATGAHRQRPRPATDDEVARTREAAARRSPLAAHAVDGVSDARLVHLLLARCPGGDTVRDEQVAERAVVDPATGACEVDAVRRTMTTAGGVAFDFDGEGHLLAVRPGTAP